MVGWGILQYVSLNEYILLAHMFPEYLAHMFPEYVHVCVCVNGPPLRIG